MFSELIALYKPFIHNTQVAAVLAYITGLIAVLIVAWLINWVLKKYIVRLVSSFCAASHVRFNQLLVQNKVFEHLSHLGPAIFIYLAVNAFTSTHYHWTEEIYRFVTVVIELYLIVIIILFFSALLDVAHGCMQNVGYLKNRSIKSYIQIVKLALWFIGFILIISRIFDVSPWAFLTSLGALSAVLILVFRDTILGFVTNIQVAANDMVRVGDWITIPTLAVDGTVTDVAINTVKIENFDKTITTIPSYALVNNNVQNWRGMVEAGGRRVMRSILIDIDSVKFCDEAMIQRFEKLFHLKNYLGRTLNEIKQHNEQLGVENVYGSINGRSLTNVGVFRKYIEFYLHQHPKVNQNLTLMVRQLDPTERGLPLQLYLFINDTNWTNFESIQSDIFDHIFAALPYFDLKIFQIATGRMH